MRILLTGPLYGAGGRETHFLHLSRLLVANGHEIVLACRYADRKTPLVQSCKELGMKCLSTPFDRLHESYRLSSAFAFVLWPFYLARYRVDIIITLEPHSRFLQFLSLFLQSSGYVLFLRAGLPTQPSEYISPAVLARLNGVLVETPLQAAASLTAHPKLPTRAIPLLGNIMPIIPSRKRRSNPVQETLCVAFLGRYDKKKGVHRLIEIWSKLNQPNVQLKFFGHGSEKSTLLDSITQKGLENHIEVNDGWTTSEELAGIMEKIDLLILPSEEEGFPVILMESMAYGVPFIATDVGAVRTYAEANPDVRVVPLDNSQIAMAIEEMVQAIRNGQIDGQRLQRYYQEHYAYEKLAAQWLDAIEHAEIWANKPHRAT